MSTGAPRRGFLQWLDERYSVRPLLDFMGHKEVPLGSHSLAWYFLGGATLFFFVIQIASGALLVMYYQPGENTAYESIRYITTKVPFGWLVRSVHCWSAHLMTICLFVHMYSTFFLKAYRKPRELTWLDRVRVVRDHAHVRLLRVSVAVERVVVFRDRRRH